MFETIHYFFEFSKLNKIYLCYNLTMQMLIISLVALSSIFILNLIVGMYHGFGYRHYWFFQLEHVLGGFFVAMFFGSFTDSWAAVLIGLGIISIVWEATEYAVAKVPSLANYIKKKLRLKNLKYSWADTVFDLVCNYAGAILLLCLLK